MKTQQIAWSGLLLVAVIALEGCADLKTELPASVAPGIQVHELGWVDTSSGNFHGKAQAAHGDAQPCLVCHGLNFQGGTSGISCVDCHRTRGASLHGKGWITPSSSNFHGNTIRSANWDMRSCQSCHGTVYDGGKVGSSCRDCHNGTGGPEGCATCHGSANPAPPRDLSNNSAITARGVGAHQIHLTGSAIAGSVACGECHVVPGAIYGVGHVDSSPGAEVVFGPISRFPTGRGTMIPNPSYSTSTIRCNNTFCHGEFKSRKVDADTTNQYAYVDSIMVGARYSPLWNGGAAEGACGTCHGSPPAGHVQPLPLTTCGNSGCHPGVVNASGQIADKTKHMNGRINVRGTERSF